MSVAVEGIDSAMLEELVAFARSCERNALVHWPALPHPADDALPSTWQQRLEHGSGVIVRQHGQIAGCLQAVGPIADFRPGAQGVYAPLTSCLVDDNVDVDRVFTTMFAALGELLAFAGTTLAAFTCFPHHIELNASLGQNGFGVRCADAVTAIADLPAVVPDIGFILEEIHWRDAAQIMEVKESLNAHLASSPMFMEHFRFTPESLAARSEQRQSVYIVALDGDRIVGFIESTFLGENYLTRSPHMRNICGAGVLPEYRNGGIMRALLIALANKYRDEGIVTLGVDYETFNPNARGFWERYFSPYTWSWERRFDMPWGAG